MIILKNNKKGILIIEILIIVAIIGIVLVSLLGLATFSLKISTLIKKTTRADALAQETVEVVRNFRDGTDWDTNGLGTLTPGVAYYSQKTADIPPKWTLIQGTETINGFTRKVVFEKVYRDGNDNIVQSGTNDPDTKKVTVTVSWTYWAKEKSIEIVTYLTNWR